LDIGIFSNLKQHRFINEKQKTMIWAALIIAVIGYFGGGHETFFLTPDLKKNVKTYVEDKEKKHEIYAIMKESKKMQKTFEKTRKGYIKKYKALNVDRNSTKDQHQALIGEYLEKRKEISALSIEKEMSMKKLCTEEEWGNIMNAIMEKTDKGKVKKSMEKTNQKFFDKLVKTFTTNISDEANRKKALASLNESKENVDIVIPMVSELSYKNIEAIRSYNAKKADYDEDAEQLRIIRKEIYDNFLKLRFQLLEYTTEEEWNIIIKDYNKLVGGGGIS
jgi:hypothetical protein